MRPSETAVLIAVMMSNDKESLPQYGINRAGVVYEAPVEGGMNRYMALIEDYDDLERIGSVRSCRHLLYLFCQRVRRYLRPLRPEHLCKEISEQCGQYQWPGGGIGGTAYYRTKDRKAPHNAYTSGERVNKAIEKLGIPHRLWGFLLRAISEFARGKEQIVPDRDDAFKVVPGYPMNQALI